VYQSEQFHTSNYRGNQAGHDNYLRSDSQSPSSFGMGQNVTSQYKGIQRSFQPTGQVNSVYGQQNQNPASFHTSSYRGDQPNHDNYLRADSTQPSQTGFSGVNSSVNYGFTSNAGYGSSYGQNQQSQQNQQNQAQYVSPNSYHTANYKGDQANHDAYLRSDSFQPTQGQFTSAYGQSSIPQQYKTQTQSFTTGSYGMNSGFANNQQSYGQQQFVSPNSFHTANYKGDQQNHDAYLRSDSAQTSQSQFGGTSMGSNINSYNKF
jgi:uncharacterized SAM-dependent methyltransferase